MKYLSILCLFLMGCDVPPDDKSPMSVICYNANGITTADPYYTGWFTLSKDKPDRPNTDFCILRKIRK